MDVRLTTLQQMCDAAVSLRTKMSNPLLSLKFCYLNEEGEWERATDAGSKVLNTEKDGVFFRCWGKKIAKKLVQKVKSSNKESGVSKKREGKKVIAFFEGGSYCVRGAYGQEEERFLNKLKKKTP